MFCMIWKFQFVFSNLLTYPPFFLWRRSTCYVSSFVDCVYMSIFLLQVFSVRILCMFNVWVHVSTHWINSAWVGWQDNIRSQHSFMLRMHRATANLAKLSREKLIKISRSRQRWLHTMQKATFASKLHSRLLHRDHILFFSCFFFFVSVMNANLTKLLNRENS